MPSIHAHFLPQLVAPEALAGGTVVVIDVLRATSTITYALAAGARRVVPCGEIDEARRIAAGLPEGGTLLGGERGGLAIEGFDLGNSPCEYTLQRVAGRTIVFTTTNGTRAMLHCRQAERVLLGAFVNLGAVVERLRSADRVHLLCAGTEGEISLEDVLAAGAIVNRLMPRLDPEAAGPWWRAELNDQARIAADMSREISPPALPLEKLSSLTGLPLEMLVPLRKTAAGAVELWLVQSKGGQNLKRVGLARDILDCAAIDRFQVVPELDVAAWEIRVS
jgi:2-phosphosulfolactate phosphatase